MIATNLSDVTPETLHHLEFALRSLASDLDDPFTLDPKGLHAALFGKNPAGYGALARTTRGELVGAALYSPLVSTAFGRSGAYVSDLWVAEPARGQKAGHALLAYVAARAGELWDAGYIRLSVYDANTGARKFYERLGFAGHDNEIAMTITGKNFELFRE